MLNYQDRSSSLKKYGNKLIKQLDFSRNPSRQSSHRTHRMLNNVYEDNIQHILQINEKAEKYLNSKG